MPSAASALREGRCPRCRSGKLFYHPSYNYLKFYKMREECPRCALKFEVEPGFYYGAMFLSYIMVVGVFAVEFLLIYLLGYIRSNLIYISVPLSVLVVLPFIFRSSRLLFLYWFGGVSYDDEYL